MAQTFGREGLDIETGTYLCATCGQDTPGNGGVHLAAVVSVLEEDGRVRNLRFCYANGCAKKLLSPSKVEAVDDPIQFTAPTPTPQESADVPAPSTGSGDDRRPRPPATADTSGDSTG